jgi:hypothetical protein
MLLHHTIVGRQARVQNNAAENSVVGWIADGQRRRLSAIGSRPGGMGESHFGPGSRRGASLGHRSKDSLCFAAVLGTRIGPSGGETFPQRSAVKETRDPSRFLLPPRIESVPGKTFHRSVADSFNEIGPDRHTSKRPTCESDRGHSAIAG